jgi:hypothetical protein
LFEFLCVLLKDLDSRQVINLSYVDKQDLDCQYFIGTAKSGSCLYGKLRYFVGEITVNEVNEGGETDLRK